jgi:acetyl-CoA carboxylase carboxyltransferase component
MSADTSLDAAEPSMGARHADQGGVKVTGRREAMLRKIAELDAEHAKAVAGGGLKYVDRHHKRGKLLPRERIELLVDEGSAFLELSPLAGWGSDYAVGASVVTGIGVVEGVECVITANDPTVRGGASNPWTVKKLFRAAQIARENRLPQVNLVESGGADLPSQKEIFIPGGDLFRGLTKASAAKTPTVALVFGNSTAGGAYVPGMSDYVVMVKEGAKVFLGGPPLVKMATGEESDDESLGGAEMHARTSGLADYLAVDEHDAIRIGRRIVARLNWRKAHPGSSAVASQQAPGPAQSNRDYAEPDRDPEELLDLIPEDLKEPFDPREVIARICDGVSATNGAVFDEFKPLYGASLVTGWAKVHGRPVGILANAQGVLFSEEAQKAAQFIQLANQIDVPLLFLHNTTGYMVGADYEQGGIIKHGAMMINAVSNSTVPHVSIMMGASYGAGNYGMCGRAYDPRFLFTWPSVKSAVMGPQQLAGVLSLVARAAAEAKGEVYDEEADVGLRRFVEDQVEAESLPFFLSGRLYDDGVIDPRDTRTVLGIALSVIDNAPYEGADRFGVFRM